MIQVRWLHTKYKYNRFVEVAEISDFIDPTSYDHLSPVRKVIYVGNPINDGLEYRAMLLGVFTDKFSDTEYRKLRKMIASNDEELWNLADIIISQKERL